MSYYYPYYPYYYAYPRYCFPLSAATWPCKPKVPSGDLGLLLTWLFPGSRPRMPSGGPALRPKWLPTTPSGDLGSRLSLPPLGWPPRQPSGGPGWRQKSRPTALQPRMRSGDRGYKHR